MALGWRDQYSRYKGFFLNIQALYKKRPDLRAFVELMLSISTVIIFINFALKPTALTIISLYNDIQTKQKTISILSKKVSDLETAGDLIYQHQPQLPDIDNSVGDSPKPDFITEQIRAIGAKDSVTILSVSIGQVALTGTSLAPKADIGILPLPANSNSMDLSFSVKGDYANVISFLKDLENLRAVTKLDTTSIRSTLSDTGQSIAIAVSGRVPFIGK